MARGVDVIYDPVGGDTLRPSCPANRLGRAAIWSSDSPADASRALPANIALLKNASIVGTFWGAYLQKDPGLVRDSFTILTDWYAAGLLKPHIHQVFDLEDASSALRQLMDRRAMGKVILKT